MDRKALILALCVGLLLASCKSKRQAVSTYRPVEATVPADASSQTAYSNDPKVGKALVKSARGWLGTPYRYGGQTKKGTDCSGMTMVLFRDVAGVAIPRNSAAQRDYCFEIPKRRLEPGDLVFFRTSKGSGKVTHVGLYIGDGKMIHASSSRGVIISDLDEKYYLNHYHSSGRVFGITYAATGGRKQSDKEVPDVRESGLLADNNAKGKKDSKKEKDVVASKVPSRPAAGLSRPSAVEMSLDEFLERQQGLRLTRLDSAIVAFSDSLDHEGLDLSPELADSIDMVPGFFEEEPDWQPLPDDHMPHAADQGGFQTDSAPSDSTVRSEKIKDSVVKAMKFGK